jgi:hypothetical protein
MLESLRVASGNGSENPIIDSEVWPDCISIVYEDEVGQQHVLTRSKMGEVTNEDPNGPIQIAIESYGQGETAATIHNCDKEPNVLLEFLDSFSAYSKILTEFRTLSGLKGLQTGR